MNKAEIIKLASALKNDKQNVTVIPDLCKIAISDREQMTEFASTTVIACYLRAVESLFDRLALKPVRVLDIRNRSSEQVLSEMDISNPVFLPEYVLPEFASEEQEAWNPIIDKERCTECGKCYDFCLFGVYEIENGTVKVQKPQNCKNNCPACARVCPAKAIIFPKYEKSPINGGLIDEEKFDEIEIKELYNSRLKYKLEERRKKITLLKK
jgi:NAD-dependent dihydropyrimidine dehydrogenase PreA subunit